MGLLHTLLASLLVITPTQATPADSTDPCVAINQGKVSVLQVERPAHIAFALADNYGDEKVTITLCARQLNGSYSSSWSAKGRTAAGGFAVPDKQDADSPRTPSGSFTWGIAFGTVNPGLGESYISLGPQSYWGFTPDRPEFNTYYEAPDRLGEKDESMWNYATTDYRQGIVINYNKPERDPKLGAGSFLHTSSEQALPKSISAEEDTIIRLQKTNVGTDRIVMGVVSEYIENTPRGPGVIPHVAPYPTSERQVKNLQRALNAHGYNLVEDGKFGIRTYHAVIDFQERVELVPDGDVGPATSHAIGGWLPPMQECQDNRP